MKKVNTLADETITNFALRCYYVLGDNGEENTEKVQEVVRQLVQINNLSSTSVNLPLGLVRALYLPNIQGIPQRQVNRVHSASRIVRYITFWVFGVIILTIWRVIENATSTRYSYIVSNIRQQLDDRFLGDKFLDPLDWLQSGRLRQYLILFEGLSTFIIIWAIIVFVIHRWRTPDQYRASVQPRIQYILSWIVGLIILLHVARDILSGIAPSIAPLLTQFTGFIPLTAIWTAAVLLWFVYKGDRSEGYNIYLLPYQGVWTAFIAILLVTILTGTIVYQSVHRRVDALLANRVLASRSVSTLVNAAGAARYNINALEQPIYDYNYFRTQETNVTDETNVTEDKAADQRRKKALQQIDLILPELERTIGSIKGTADDALAFTEAAIKNEAEIGSYSASNNQNRIQNVNLSSAGTSLLQTRDVLKSVKVSTEAIDLSSIEAEVINLKDNADRTFDAFLTMINRDLQARLDNIYNKSFVANSTITALNTAVLAPFLWTAALFAVFILFPWILLLLFLYRKKANRAAQILLDLQRLDPDNKYQLIERVIRGGPESKQKMVEWSNWLQGPATSGGQDDSDNRQSQLTELLARRAFGNFEYIICLIVLSSLIAIGWYYLLYPQTSQGLAALIQRGGDIKQVIDNIVSNVTPVTLGFVGAYFYIAQMLVRRYLADDLYPTAFLQASLRFILVFALTIALSLLVPQTVTSDSGNGLQVSPVSTPIQTSLNTVTPTPTATSTATPTENAISTDIKIQSITNLQLVAAESATPASIPSPSGISVTVSPPGPESPPDSNIWTTLLLLLAFFAGIFPTSVASFLRSIVNKWSKHRLPDFSETAPLTKLDGVNFWTEVRLSEEGIENVESLATASIEQLVLHTRYPTAQIVDWIDQAILYAHAGSEGEWFLLLRKAGIRSASNLLTAGGLYTQVSIASLQVGPTGGTGTDYFGAIETAVSKVDPNITVQQPNTKLTDHVLRQICRAILAEANLPFILNFLRAQPSELQAQVTELQAQVTELQAQILAS